MSAKMIIIFGVQALFAHVVFSQCIRSGGEDVRAFIIPPASISPCGSLRANSVGFGDGFGFGAGSGYGLGIGASIGSGFAGDGFNSAGIGTSGGAFPVNSIAAIAPNGIAVASENVYEGCLGVVGELPFLSTVAFEGVLPSAGVGVVNHGCGNGITAITNEIDNSAGVIGAGGIGAGIGYGIGSGIIGAGGIDSGIVGATGIGFGAFGNGLCLGGSSSGIDFNIGQAGGRGCGCGWY